MLVMILALALLASCGSGGPPPDPEAGLRITREEDGYMVREGASPVLFYRLAPKSLDGEFERSNYIHPLYGLDGEVLTEDFPEDHPHHRGIYWTWHQVWIGEVRAGDPWLARSFSWKVRDERVLPEGNGLVVSHRWLSPDFGGGEQPILEETAELTVSRSTGSVRMIDFDIRLVPLQEGVRLGGSEDDKGYGGFSVRLRMLPDLRMVASGGPVEPRVRAVEAGDWVDFSGGFASSGTPSGVAVIVHPKSAGYPQSWILRSPATPSMQNPVWPGRDPTLLAQGGETRLRYRLVVHRGSGTSLDLDSLARRFAAEP